MLTKTTSPTSFKCKPSSSKFSAKMLLNPFNLQTRFRMLLAAIFLSFNLFCALHNHDEIKTLFTLLSLNYWPIFTIHFAISFSVGCLFPILLQPMCSIKTFGVPSFKIGFTCLHLFQSDAYKRFKSCTTFNQF